MKTTVLLIRHGETEWNTLGKFQGCTDIALSDEGIKQAKLLKDRLDGNFDYIYSSPLSRALETSKILAEDSNKEVIVAPEIREINFGEWEGLTIKEISEKYPEIFKAWRTDKRESYICGGDASIKNAANRASKCILDIVSKHKGKKIVIVAHGGIIKAGLIGIFEWDMTMYHKIALGNTCINLITFNDELKPAIVSINDTNHLEDKAKTV
ncbi:MULTISPECIES: histidine phosphatase family protein [unclassified Clostridium]|uniref:histidine phosphatase family protein n=1 Tax=unclassified Clostridium TaxID=2614128 RepID=UPI000297D431|nr:MULTISPECIES: histidine phosphatase family protein [unclassified Clostridium]EKQ58237.1 MAG: fructose-2,6-bisphosphatase [Clostridium sp. Maddingley MBC34-26]